MKSNNYRFASILFILLTQIYSVGSVHAQQSPITNENITSATAIIEGVVIRTQWFESKNHNPCTLAWIRVSKIFKGIQLDSIIEVVVPGGMINGIAEISSSGFSLRKGYDGIFFMSDNNSIKSDSLSSDAFYNGLFIKYNHEPELVAHHYATFRGFTFDNLEYDLFQKIESLTGQKRKVLGLNSFEQAAFKEKK